MMTFLSKIGLLPRILIAIILGIVIGQVLPLWGVRLFSTFNALFAQLLSFAVPLIIVALVAVAIAEIGRSAGRLLLITVVLAYAATLVSGFFAYAVSDLTFPLLIDGGTPQTTDVEATKVMPYFELAIPPLLDVMTALVLAFTLGLGMAYINGGALKATMTDVRDVVMKLIGSVILPLLPLYIFGIFLSMTYTGETFRLLGVFAQIIGIIFAMHIILLVFQYVVAFLITGRNPFRALWCMMPAYFTALGTQSSAATIPVTVDRTKANGVRSAIADFVIPLCATIHLSGSTLKIVACALALMLMQGMPYDVGMMTGFICMLGVTMVAAPGVPGGAIMAAIGILQSMLGFDTQAQALMIALYITMDSFGTACNVTGDGAIALIVDKWLGDKVDESRQK